MRGKAGTCQLGDKEARAKETDTQVRANDVL
jgi:hypothetical protein